MKTPHNPTASQIMFREIAVGTLIYSVVLGFFNDYTNVLYTSSYSVTFLAALLMQLLIYPTFKLKGYVARKFKDKEGKRHKLGLVMCIWAIMFLSKFVFLAALNFAFGESIEISGFFGLIAIIVSATLLTKIAHVVYAKLG